jgi:hypothetical protein
MPSKIVVAAIGMACVLSALADAAIIIYEPNFEFSEATPPAGTPPWLRVTIDDHDGVGSVDLTLTAINLVASEFVTEWDLNLDPTLSPASLIFSAPTKTGTFADPTIGLGVNAFQADGDGLYDISFGFSTSGAGGGVNRFTAGDSVSYTISGIPTLNAFSFLFLSAPSGGKGPFYTAAHVQGIGASGNDSGWVAPQNGGVIIIPEPVSAAAFGVAGLLLAARRRRRT